MVVFVRLTSYLSCNIINPIMKIIKPSKLHRGDLVGIISPSSNISGRRSELNKGIRFLEKELGLKVKLGKNCLKKYFYSAGTPQMRVDDVHEMFNNPEIKAVFMSVGGETANEVLELIDFDLIKKNPKIFAGMSDGTTLLTPIAEKTGLITYYGPDVLYGFARSMRDEIRQNMVESWFDGNVKELRPIKNFKRADNKRPIKSGRRCVRKGKAKGVLIGGYLEIVCLLIATKQLSGFKNKILFLENMGDSPTIHTLLQTLKLAGVFDQISGLLLGFFPDAQPGTEKYRPVGEIVLEITKGYSFPILQINELGHNVENYVFPMGIKTRLDATDKTVGFLEKLVR